MREERRVDRKEIEDGESKEAWESRHEGDGGRVRSAQDEVGKGAGGRQAREATSDEKSDEDVTVQSQSSEKPKTPENGERAASGRGAERGQADGHLGGGESSGALSAAASGLGLGLGSRRRGPRRSRPGWVVRVSSRGRLGPCRRGWAASGRPLREEAQGVGSLSGAARSRRPADRDAQATRWVARGPRGKERLALHSRALQGGSETGHPRALDGQPREPLARPARAAALRSGHSGRCSITQTPCPPRNGLVPTLLRKVGPGRKEAMPKGTAPGWAALGSQTSWGGSGELKCSHAASQHPPKPTPDPSRHTGWRGCPRTRSLSSK